jgi:hypothetical protein
MRKIIALLCTTILCATLLLSALLTFDVQISQAAPGGKQNGPEVNAAVQHDTSPPLRGMSSVSEGADKHKEKPLRPYPGAKSNNPKPDGALQSATGPLVSTTNGLNFAGVGNGDYGFTPNAAPPDTNGAVGATQYVQWVNSSFAVFDKATGAIAPGFPKTGNTLWSGFGGGCQTNNDGDPIVQYDKAANRWILTQFSVSTTPYLQCVAVSTTSDATGSYNRYAFSYGTGFNDYPKLGVWPDGYYITFNMFTNGQTFAGAKVCAYDRSSMLAGGTATQQCFNTSTSYGGLLPSDLDGSTAPPAGSPNYVLNYGSNSLNLWKFHVDWTTPANSTFTGPTTIPVAAFSPACNGGGTCIPQSGTTQQLDSLADRMMYRLAYRNFGDHEALVINHSVTAGSSVGIRWHELRNPGATSPTVYQQSTFAPDSTYRWMGSIAMDKLGNMALGYSASSSSLFPSIRYTGRLATDPLNSMGTENSIVTGGGAQSGSNLSRWGDYSAMTLDPVDDCTFWYTTEYLKSTGAFNWSTRIASFKFPGCGSTTTNDFSLSANPSSLSLNQASSGTSTISTATTSGSAQTVSLTISGLPSGASASFNPTSVSSGSSSTLTINSGTATPGS